MKREEAIWNSGHEVLVIRRENLFSVEEAEWEESMIRIFSDEYEGKSCENRALPSQ
jgi:hypothetical protein